MKRREFLIGTAATAVAAIAQIPLPALAKPVEPEDYIVRYSDVLLEMSNVSRKFAAIDVPNVRPFIIRGIMEREKRAAKAQGRPLHLYIDMGKFWPPMWKRPTPGHYISDKISVIQSNGTFQLVKDRTKVIDHAKA
jgi:hypothetical protein